MIKLLAAGALIALASGVGGCARKEEGELLVVIQSASYYRCDDKCSSFAIKISIKNETQHVYCVPEDFLSENLSEHMIFYDRDGRENQQVTPSGYPSISPVENESEMARQYRLVPNYIVQPGQARTLDIYTGDKFAVDAKGGKIVAGIPAFRCEAGEGRTGDGYGVRTVSFNVAPHRP